MSDQPYHKTEAARQANRQAVARYRASAKGKATNHRCDQNYCKSEQGKLHRKNYVASAAGAAAAKRAQDKYNKSDSQKANLHRYHKTPKGRWQAYINSAKNRGIDFSLSFDQFMTFWQKPCHYCNDPIATVGLDRRDGQQGYTLGNVVPCCRTCNTGKMSLNSAEYIAHCLKVVKHST